jgi:endonuclease YncB( thermonuclease family)
VCRLGSLALVLGLLLGCHGGQGCAGRAQAPADRGRPGVPAGAVADPASNDRGGVFQGGRSPEHPSERSGRVVRVRDGDSLVVLLDGVGAEIRLDGVDAPELVQAFGRKARSFTADLASGREVRVAEKGRDKYDRILAEIFLPAGRSLNRELVSAGFAWWFRKYSTDRDLESRERQAREARRGLWADPRPVPPWDFRARQPVRRGSR